MSLSDLYAAYYGTAWAELGIAIIAIPNLTIPLLNHRCGPPHNAFQVVQSAANEIYEGYYWNDGRTVPGAVI